MFGQRQVSHVLFNYQLQQVRYHAIYIFNHEFLCLNFARQCIIHQTRKSKSNSALLNINILSMLCIFLLNLCNFLSPSVFVVFAKLACCADSDNRNFVTVRYVLGLKRLKILSFLPSLLAVQIVIIEICDCAICLRAKTIKNTVFLPSLLAVQIVIIEIL